MDGSSVFILRATEVKHKTRDSGEKTREGTEEKGRKGRKRDAERDRHICYIDQQITAVYMGGEVSPSSTIASGVPGSTGNFSRYPTLFCTSG